MQSFVQAATIRSPPLAERSLDLRLLDDLQRRIDLDPEIPGRAFQLRVPKEKLEEEGLGGYRKLFEAK